MRVFESRSFRKWAREEGLSEADLLLAINEMEEGLTGSNLGGNVFKKRVRLEGRGKSGGARTIIAYRTKQKAFFVFGFAKNERGNVSGKEEESLKKLAKVLLGYSDQELEKACKVGELIELTKRMSNG
jgi:hypothetical protein